MQRSEYEHMLTPTLALSIPLLTPKDHSHYQQSWSPCPHSSSDTSLSSGHCILNSAYWEAWVMKSIVNYNLREMHYHSHSISNMHCVFTNHPAYKEIIWKSCFYFVFSLWWLIWKLIHLEPHILNTHLKIFHYRFAKIGH